MSYKQKTRHHQSKGSKKQPNSARKIRIYPEPKLAHTWSHWLAGCRFVYNRAIEFLKEGWTGTSYELEKIVLNNLPEWLETVPRHPKANAVQDAYDAFKQAKKQGGVAKFRSCRQPNQTIKFKVGDYLNNSWFPRLTKGLKFLCQQEYPTNCSYGTQLVRDRGRWFAIFPFFQEESFCVESSKVISLDPGVRTFLTGYDGENILEFGLGDIKRIFRLCFHLDKLIGRFSATEIRSKQRRSLRRASFRVRNKIRNLVDELHHQVAHYLVSNYKVIFLPTFETKQMACKATRKINRKTARNLLTLGHYRFKQTLKTMAQKSGVIVVDVNESYTSKTCGKCGTIKQNLGGAEVYKCSSCGYRANRDWNGARNIMLRALSDTTFTLSGNAIEVFGMSDISQFSQTIL
jgi:putative transposase